MAHLRQLLDTTVLIDLTKGSDDAIDFIDWQRKQGAVLCVSVISAMGLIVGCRNKREAEHARGLLDAFAMLHISPGISELAFEWLSDYSKSHGLLIPDALIGATAFHNDLVLKSDNLKDFRFLPGLAVERPY